MSRIDFEAAVLERSRQVPVVVDFWAPWCGPCRILGPIIEELAGEAAGRWELVKVNADDHPELARDYEIRGIPAVKMFSGGQVIAEFTGVLPAEAIRSWLDDHLPNPAQDRVAAIAERWIEDGSQIAEELEALVAAEPGFALARVRLAQALLGTDPARARELLESDEIPSDLLELVEDVTALVEVMELSEAPDKLQVPYEAAREALGQHQLDETLEHLVNAATIDREFGNQLARRAAVALFHLLGQDHEWTRKHQRRLAMVLHS